MAFELGPVYKPLDNSELPDQRTSLAVVLSGTNTQKHWSREEQPFDFYDIKGIAEAVLDFFHVTAAFEPCDLGLLTQGRAASVVLDATPVGFLGEVSFPVRAAYGLNQPAYILELDLQDLLERPLPIPQFTPIPTYPASLRDMAVVVDAATPAGKLQEVALEVGGKLLRHVHIFDIYEGKQVPPGKKSVALSLVFQSPEKTLTDKDTQKAWDKILGAFQRDYQAELR